MAYACDRVWGDEGGSADALVQPTMTLSDDIIGEQRRHHSLQRAAVTDPLTGVGNRAALRELLDAASGP